VQWVDVMGPPRLYVLLLHAVHAFAPLFWPVAHGASVGGVGGAASMQVLGGIGWVGVGRKRRQLVKWAKMMVAYGWQGVGGSVHADIRMQGHMLGEAGGEAHMRENGDQ
jgi:hypothetical protein